MGQCLRLTMSMALVLSCFSLVSGFIHGEPEDTDRPGGAISAREIMRRLWEAARERSDVVRENRNKAEGTSTPRPPSNSDAFGMLMDYVKDKVTNPPLLSVEQNLLLVHQSTQILATEVIANRMLLNQLLEQYETDFDQTDLKSVLQKQLVPVQGPRYTIINKTKN